MTITNEKQVSLAITGASGAPYALRLLQQLVNADYDVHLMISSAAKVVMATEEDFKLPANDKAAQYIADKIFCDQRRIHVYNKEDWFAPVASGSSAPKKMIICPCSTGTLSAVANGASDNLIERAADVVLKERGQLIIVPREMPLSSIHLEHMLKLSQMGATIMPASPGYYHNPKEIIDLVDFVVARILDHLGIKQGLMLPWGYGKK